LKQLGFAVQGLVSVSGRYPSNGWGSCWIGDPDRDTGKSQPGGWVYNVLDYVEQGDLRALGRGAQAPAKRRALTKLTQVPIAVVHCPSRAALPLSLAAQLALRNADWAPTVAKTDYAINGGDQVFAAGEGPATLAEGDSAQYSWPSTRSATGISFLRSAITPAAVQDGLSNTYLIGEKYVSIAGDSNGADPGYQQSAYGGASPDLNRFVAVPPHRDSPGTDDQAFGSAHPSGCHFVFCDGAARIIRYSIDRETHRRLGNRKDKLPVDLGGL
jgi:hypothetical protein